MELVDRLLKEEIDDLTPRLARSRAHQQEAQRRLPNGVTCDWDLLPNGPVIIDHGSGSRIFDIDGNEYVDFHNGYGVMIMGHANPKIVAAITERASRGTHFGLSGTDALVCADNLAERYGLPVWRFSNSGTEATQDAVHIMRQTTGRQKIIKIEGAYHGRNDSLMVSVSPEPETAGPRENPTPHASDGGLPDGVVGLVVPVPFNDLGAVQRAFADNPGQIAGMIMEPCMANAGLVPPEPGYLKGIKDLCHRNGALLTFDEVKVGITLSWGGGTRAFGITPDLVCLAKAIGAGLPCGAIGGTEEAMSVLLGEDLEQAGTFNGNPLTMAAMRANLTEVLTPEAYGRFDEIAEILGGIGEVIDSYRLPANLRTMGAKGSVEWSATPVRDHRDLWEIDGRLPDLAWVWQANRGVFEPPWNKWESWTVSLAHSDEDVQRYVDNFASLAVALTA